MVFILGPNDARPMHRGWLFLYATVTIGNAGVIVYVWLTIGMLAVDMDVVNMQHVPYSGWKRTARGTCIARGCRHVRWYAPKRGYDRFYDHVSYRVLTWMSVIQDTLHMIGMIM